MDDIELMHIRKGAHYFFYYCSNNLLAVVPAFLHNFEQWASLAVLSDDAVYIFVDIDFVDFNDVGVVEFP